MKKRKDAKATKSEFPIDMLHNFPDSELSDERAKGGKRTNEETVLPKEHTEALLSRIKKLVTMWAEEVSSKFNLSVGHATQ
jgi:hypothetical protein